MRGPVLLLLLASFVSCTRAAPGRAPSSIGAASGKTHEMRERLELVLAAMEHKPGAPSIESGIVQQAIEVLDESPDATYLAIQDFLPTIDPARVSARQFLVGYAAKLPVDRNERMKLLSAEVMRPVEESAQAGPSVMALQRIMELDPDGARSESVVRLAASSHKDGDTRKALLKAFLSKYPGRASALGID